MALRQLDAPLDGDGDERKDAGEDEDGQSVVQQRTERIAAEQRPLARRRHVLERLERHDQRRHERVARRQVDDVEVGDRAHVSVARDGQYDDGVAEQREDDDDDVENDEDVTDDVRLGVVDVVVVQRQFFRAVVGRGCVRGRRHFDVVTCPRDKWLYEMKIVGLPQRS